MQPRETAVRLDLSTKHLDLLCALLGQHVPDAEVWAFGSRVTGGAHEGSDLDLVLRDAHEPARPVAGAQSLRDALQDSLLPMTVELHEWANLPDGFRSEIADRHLKIEPDR